MERKASFGSISEGTLRSADLIENFSAELEWLNGTLTRPQSEKDLLAECAAWLEREYDESEPCQDTHEELGSELVQELMDALEERANCVRSGQ